MMVHDVVSPQPGVILAAKHLSEHKWVSLSQLGVLLGYKNKRSIYQRQRGRHPVTILRVGRVDRVHEHDALEALANHSDQAWADSVLEIYKRQGTEEDGNSIRLT